MTITTEESGHFGIQSIPNEARLVYRKRVVSITKHIKKPTNVREKSQKTLGSLFEHETCKTPSSIRHLHDVKSKHQEQKKQMRRLPKMSIRMISQKDDKIHLIKPTLTITSYHLV